VRRRESCLLLMVLVAASLVLGMSSLSVSQEAVAIVGIAYEVINSRAASEGQAIPGDEVRVTATLAIAETYADSSPILVEFYYYGDLEGRAGFIGSDQLLPVPGVARTYSVSVTWHTTDVSRDRYRFRVRAAGVTADSDEQLVMLEDGVAIMSYSDTSEADAIPDVVRLNPTEPGGYNLSGSALIKFTNLGSDPVKRDDVYYRLVYKVFEPGSDPEDTEFVALQEGTVQSTVQDPIIQMFMSTDVAAGADGRIYVQTFDVGELVKRLYMEEAQADVFHPLELPLPEGIGETAYIQLRLDLWPSDPNVATDPEDTDSLPPADPMEIYLPTLQPDGYFIAHTDIEPFEITAVMAGWSATAAPVATTNRFLFDAVSTDRDRVYVTSGNALLAMTQYGTILDPGALRIPNEAATTLSQPLASYDADEEQPLVIVSDGVNRVYAYSDEIPLGQNVESALLSKAPIWSTPEDSLGGSTVVGSPVLLEDARPGPLGEDEIDRDLTAVLVASTNGLYSFNGQLGTLEWRSLIDGIGWAPLIAHKSDRRQLGFDRSLVFVATTGDLYYREMIQGVALRQVPILPPSTALVGAYVSASDTDGVDAYVIYLTSGESVRTYVVRESSSDGDFSYSISEDSGARQQIQGASRFVSLKLFSTEAGKTHWLFLLTELGEIYVLKYEYTADPASGEIDIAVAGAAAPWTLTRRVAGPLDGLVLSESGDSGFEVALFVSTTDGLLQGVRFTEAAVDQFRALELEIWAQEAEGGFADASSCNGCTLGPPRVFETPYGWRLFIGATDGVLRVLDLEQYDSEADGTDIDSVDDQDADAEGSV